MIFLDRLLTGGVRFVLERLLEAAEAEQDDDGPLKELLLEAQMQLELGEISEEEFGTIEAEVLARLREIRERRMGGTSAPVSGALEAEVGVADEVTWTEQGDAPADAAEPVAAAGPSDSTETPRRRSRRR